MHEFSLPKAHALSADVDLLSLCLLLAGQAKRHLSSDDHEEGGGYFSTFVHHCALIIKLQLYVLSDIPE